jgi:hypothetical protein
MNGAPHLSNASFSFPAGIVRNAQSRQGKKPLKNPSASLRGGFPQTQFQPLDIAHAIAL